MRERDLHAYIPDGKGLEVKKGNETLEAHFGVVVIFGASGAGKTVAASGLGEVLNIPSSNVIKAGQDIRAVGLDRGVEVDRTVDDHTRNLIQNADISSPIIIEARLGGYLATEALAENPKIPVVRILFTASRDTRTNRIWNRRVEQIKATILSPDTTDEKKEAIIDMLANRELTKRFIEEKEIRREERDREIWSGLYPELKDIDLFDPRTTINGTKMWDIIINTSNLNKEETEETLIESLIEAGRVKRINPSKRKISLL